MYVNSSMTAKEEFRIHGYLTEAATERLLDTQIKDEDLSEIDTCLTEIIAGLPNEDFLVDVFDALDTMIAQYRGKHLDLLKRARADLERVQGEVNQGIEHAHEHIRKVSDKLNEMGKNL